MNLFLIEILSLIAIISRILVITSNNPIISVLFLISVFVNVAGYLLLMGVGFVGISYLIVYVGAIAILFLFVVMILNIQLTEIVSRGREYTKNLPLGFIVGSLFIFEIVSIIPNKIYSLRDITLNTINWMNILFLGIQQNYDINDVNIMFSTSNADINFRQYLQVEAIGQGLYTYGTIQLILRSLILLLAIVGPIVLCLQNLDNYKHINPNNNW